MTTSTARAGSACNARSSDRRAAYRASMRALDLGAGKARASTPRCSRATMPPRTRQWPRPSPSAPPIVGPDRRPDTTCTRGTRHASAWRRRARARGPCARPAPCVAQSPLAPCPVRARTRLRRHEGRGHAPLPSNQPGSAPCRKRTANIRSAHSPQCDADARSLIVVYYTQH